MAAFPIPKVGASLLLAFRLENRTALIVGSGSLAASRAFAALESGAEVVIFAKGGLNSACEELKWRAQQGQVSIVDLGASPEHSVHELQVLESYISQSSKISLVCVTDTILCHGASLDSRRALATRIYQLCNEHKNPVNLTDMPDLCDFTFASTHRFLDPNTGEKTPLQVGVTTNGRGCRLAGRFRREIVARMHKEFGPAVGKVGALRALAKAEEVEKEAETVGDDEATEDSGVSTPNRAAPLWNPSTTETSIESARRRMKWVAQLSEYWPVERLARMTAVEMHEVLGSGDRNEHVLTAAPLHSQHTLSIVPS